MSKWIPITEQEPEEGARILVSTEDGVVFAFLYDKDICRDVIAWRPLPAPYEPPKSKEYNMDSEEAAWRLKEMYLNCECESQGAECELCSKAVYKAIHDMDKVATIKYDLE